MLTNDKKTMEQLLTITKNRGFVYAGSEIYGGLSNTWDYGPLGIELKNNIKKAWWQKFIVESRNNVGIDAAILMNTKVWEASGHVAGFSDPLMDCMDCKTRHRADHLIEGIGLAPDGWSHDEMEECIKENGITCPNCGSTNFTKIREFNLMFKTHQGVTSDSQSELYLRPETAQGIFVNFANVVRTSRKKIPFGIGQIGKSFRNEITPGNFIFRTREFEQMEMEFFCKPGTDEEWFAYWKKYCWDFLVALGIKPENIRNKDHEQAALSHYSKATTDIEYLYPFGWGELWGVANRTDFDLTQHMNHSGKQIDYFDPETNERYIPYVIEPSVGVDRALLAFLCDAYDEEILEDGDLRKVMRLSPILAPYKVAILPLSKKLSDKALDVYDELSKHFSVTYDETGSIGRRYRRQDEIGTPFCITYDFETEETGKITVRDRDTMEQIHVSLDELIPYIEEKIKF